jgi:hypothetical protein
MNTPLNFASNLAGRVTRAMVQLRTHELALLTGRSSLEVSFADYEQAKRDVTGESDPMRQEEKLDGS